MVLLPILFTLFGSELRHKYIKNDEEIRELAKQQVNVIQENYNDGALLEIYNKGTNDFKKITPEGDFLLLMKRKKEVLGYFVSSELLTSNVINSNVVILTYRSTYKNYSLIEEFQFIRKHKDDDLQLGTYFIDDGGQRGDVIMQ